MVSDKIKALLQLSGKKQYELKEPLGIDTDAVLRNKFSRGCFSADELIAIAASVGAELCFRTADGQIIAMGENDIRPNLGKKEKPGRVTRA